MNKKEIVCPCLDCGKETIHTDYYMVKNKLWMQAVPDAVPMTIRARKKLPHGDGNYLCIKCLEARIGRKLEKRDFLAEPWLSDVEISKGITLPKKSS